MRTRPRLRSRAGFGLLAVLLLLLAIAVAASVAIPWFFGRAEVTLDNAAQLLSRDIRSAQNRSLWMTADTLILFDADGGGYRIIDREGRMVERLGALGDLEQRYDEGGVFEGVRLTRVDCGPDRALTFDGAKREWEGGEIEISFRGESRLIRVQQRTGQVNIVSTFDAR